MKDEYLSIKQLCKALSMSRTTLWRRRKAGLLNGIYENGTRVVFAANEVDGYMNAQKKDKEVRSANK